MVEFPSIIDSTIIAAKRSCLQKVFRTYIEHWKPKGESIHLHAGAAFARGLEAARRLYYEDGTDAETAIAGGFQALTEAYGGFQPPEGSAKTLAGMQGALLYYFNRWPLGVGSCNPHLFPSGKHGIEFSFSLPLPYLHPVTKDPIIYCGRSDMIADFADGLYIEDDKTASQLGPSWSRQWELRSQFTGYCWAAQESGFPVNGVIIRGVSILKRGYGDAEHITYRSQWEIDRWLKQLLKDLADMESAWQSGYWDYALDHACDEYGGCSLKQICKSPEPETWLPMYFEKRKWNPLDRSEVKLEA